MTSVFNFTRPRALFMPQSVYIKINTIHTLPAHGQPSCTEKPLCLSEEEKC